MKISFEIGDKVIHKEHGAAEVVNVSRGQSTIYTIKLKDRKIRCWKASLKPIKKEIR